MKLFRKLNSSGHSHILIPLLVILVVGGIGTYIATKSLGHASSTSYVQCTRGSANGRTVYTCGWSLPTPVRYSNNTSAGSFYRGSRNYIFCQKPGLKVSRGSYYNTWWGYTLSDQGHYGWANAVYTTSGANNYGFAYASGSSWVKVPTCSSGTPPGGSASTPPPPPKPGTNNKGQAILSKAQTKIGTPYVFGGGNINGPTNGGFDCSGLIMYAVYQALRVQLPHYTGSQVTTLPKVGAHVISTNGPFLPGDILFFYPAPSYDHVVIYAGSGKGLDAHDYGAPVGYYPLSANGGGHVTAAFRF